MAAPTLSTVAAVVAAGMMPPPLVDAFEQDPDTGLAATALTLKLLQGDIAAAHRAVRSLHGHNTAQVTTVDVANAILLGALMGQAHIRPLHEITSSEFLEIVEAAAVAAVRTEAAQ